MTKLPEDNDPETDRTDAKPTARTDKVPSAAARPGARIARPAKPDSTAAVRDGNGLRSDEDDDRDQDRDADRGADTRLADGAGQRGDRRLDEDRTHSRAMADREQSEDREMSDELRLQMFAQNFSEGALPSLPDIDDYHTIWLTTNNPRDPIHARLRVGYELIKLEEISGWADNLSIKTGEYAGCIGVNEMIAAKLPDRLYQMFMAENHHHAPNREEERLDNDLNELQEQARRKKARLYVEEGNEEMRQSRVPVPEFHG